MKAWRVHDLLTARLHGFAGMRPEDQRRAVEAVLSLIAEARREDLALANAQHSLGMAIGHLQAVLNKARSAAEQQAADTAARDWLLSIGSDPF